MIILNIRITDRSLLKGLGRRMSGIYKQVLIDVAWHWHRHMLRQHFTSAARGRYGYRPRTAKYTSFKRKRGIGQGRFIDLWFTGESRRWLMEGAQVTGTSGRATLRMRAPWYFTNPAGQIQNKRGKRFSSHSQPDKVAEVTAFDERDRKELRRFAGQRLAFFIDQARPAPRTVDVTG